MESSGNYNQMMSSSSSPTNYDTSSCINGTTTDQADDEYSDLRRGPWTIEEDLVLVNYINIHSEGRWNALARCAGLKRTGKSCRLRWLNYLRPDVRRGNITPEEQLLILELHSRWGNRWSKIAQHLPGRTDNEIKNYWRTRVQKHAKQLQCDVNSKQFQDAMRYLWMPRLIERIKADRAEKDAAAAAMMAPTVQSSFSTAASTTTTTTTHQVPQITASFSHTTSSSPEIESVVNTLPEIQMPPSSSSLMMMHDHLILQAGPENNMEEYNYFGSTINNSDSTTCYSDFPAAATTGLISGSCSGYQQFSGQFGVFPSDQISTTNISYYFDNNVNNYMEGNLSSSDDQSLWSSENMWLLEQQLCEGI